MSYTILGPDGQPFDGSLDRATRVNYGKTKEVSKLPNGNFAISHKDIDLVKKCDISFNDPKGNIRIFSKV